MHFSCIHYYYYDLFLLCIYYALFRWQSSSLIPEGGQGTADTGAKTENTFWCLSWCDVPEENNIIIVFIKITNILYIH